MNETMYTATAYAELHGITVDTVRRHCRKGTLECDLLAGAGHGMYLIPERAKIQLKKRGRKLGWRKK
jgi:hypothetical protein